MAAQILDMHRIGQYHRNALFQYIEHRLPIRTGTLHYHMRAALAHQPLTQLLEFAHRGIVLPLLHLRLLTRRTGQQADHDKSFADIDTGASLQDHFDHRVSFWSSQRIKS